MKRSLDQLKQWQKVGDVMDVQFITSLAVITPDPSVSRRLDVDGLGLPFTAVEGDKYRRSEDIGRSKSFGVWPLTQAAQACFGTRDWPTDRTGAPGEHRVRGRGSFHRPSRRGRVEKEGFTLLHEAHTEPWGQTVARLQSSEGAIIGVAQPTGV
jgi:hypothetical protein